MKQPSPQIGNSNGFNVTTSTQIGAFKSKSKGFVTKPVDP